MQNYKEEKNSVIYDLIFLPSSYKIGNLSDYMTWQPIPVKLLSQVYNFHPKFWKCGLHLELSIKIVLTLQINM